VPTKKQQYTAEGVEKRVFVNKQARRLKEKICNIQAASFDGENPKIDSLTSFVRATDFAQNSDRILDI